MARIAFQAAFAFALVGYACTASVAQGGDRADPAVALVHKHVEGLKAEGAEIKLLGGETLKLFPDLRFVSVRFRMWPVAYAPPEPLRSQNLFVVEKEKLKHLTSAKELAPYFQGLPMTSKPDVVLAYALLTQEFIQDGFYKFELNKDVVAELDSKGDVAAFIGKLMVVPEMGNMGFLEIRLAVGGETGARKVTGVSEENKVVRGVRPRCQATYLLHADPLIRAICEQDLLVMGRSAEVYLNEQRARATPDLQREIDRVWRRIIAEGR